MNYISFDIGIKNMAYCIFSIQDNQFLIRDWNVINLIETEQHNYKCDCIIPPKTKKNVEKICNKKAKLFKNDKYYCEKHAKSNKQFILPTKQNSLSYIKKCKNEDLLKIGRSHFLFTNEDSKKLKKIELIEQLTNFYQNKCYENIIQKKEKNANNIDLINIGKKMKEKMNLIPLIDDIHFVIIENQISPIANRMKTIQGMLAQFFIMKNDDIHIEFVSSSNKLKQFNDLKCQNEFIEKNSYKENKKDGIHYCKLILQNNITLNDWINSLDIKKKDDLADAFLQGIWFLKRQNIIYYADDLKINLV